MRFLKSGIIGFAAALVAAVMWVLAVLIVPVFLPLLISRLTGTGGSGGSGASVGSGSILAAALVGFLVGFVWNFRRASRPRADLR